MHRYSGPGFSLLCLTKKWGWGEGCREWYMEPLWIFALRFVRDVMKLLSCDLVPEVSVIGISPEWVSHTLVFWFQGKNTLFQIAFFVNCSHAEEKNKSHTLKQVAHSGAAVSWAPASTTLIYITLVFPIRADVVPYELLIELLRCWELMHASHTSQLDIHKIK